jgi:hypothetical protein
MEKDKDGGYSDQRLREAISDTELCLWE